MVDFIKRFCCLWWDFIQLRSDNYNGCPSTIFSVSHFHDCGETLYNYGQLIIIVACIRYSVSHLHDCGETLYNCGQIIIIVARIRYSVSHFHDCDETWAVQRTLPFRSDAQHQIEKIWFYISVLVSEIPIKT